MPKYRNNLPQLSGGMFLTDAGIETDLIFNHGIEIREFAAHTLFETEEGRAALSHYFHGFLTLAKDAGTGFILDSQTWKAHMHWADDLGQTAEDLRAATHQSIAFIADLRAQYAGNRGPIVLNGLIGPCGDAYAPEDLITPREAKDYHAQQIAWLAETDVDMVSAVTFTQADEAIGVVRAAAEADLPIAVSFTVETDGRLPTGQSLDDAINYVDTETENGAAYFMVNCAHPSHFAHIFDDRPWAHRIKGLRCNASRMSHAELDACEVLDDGDPSELARENLSIKRQMPWLNIFGGCCGSDLRHVTKIAEELALPA